MLRKGYVFHTLYLLLFLNLYYKNVCSYLHLPGNVVFLSSFLNTKQVNKKKHLRFFSTNFNYSEIGKLANDQYQIQVVLHSWGFTL